MKFSLPRDAFAAALNRVLRVIEPRNTIPILSHMRGAVQGNRLHLTGTDLDIEVAAGIDVEDATDGTVAFPAKILREFVHKLPDSARVTATLKDGRLTVSSGRSRATVNTLAATDFPDISSGTFDHVFEVGAAALLAMADRVSFAISTEETRYYLNGIYLHGIEGADGPLLRAVATDGHRLAQHQMPAPAGAEGLKGVIVPRKAVAEISQILKPMGEDIVRVEVSATKLRLTAGTTTLTTKLVDGTFPDYDRVIPTGNDRHATVEAAALSSAVDRVGTIASDRGRAVRFAFSGQGLSLSVRNPDTGDATDEVEAAFQGEDLEIGFNGRYVGDVLSALPGGTVRLAMGDPSSPCLITAPGDATSLFVLMPMRV